jgi:hypothetical protein
MTDTITSQNIDLSSWDTLYIYIYIYIYIHTHTHTQLVLTVIRTYSYHTITQRDVHLKIL